MTREEAKQIISDIDKAYRNFTADEYKALEMAIQALSQEPTIGQLFSCEEVEELRSKIWKQVEQEPCDDAISREELLKAISTWDKFGCDADTKLVRYQDHYVPYIHYDDVIKCIKGMPPVTPSNKGWEEMTVPCENCGHDMTFKIAVCGEPSRPRGHWIVETDGDWEIKITKCICSNCGKSALKDKDYSMDGVSIKYVMSPFCPNCGVEMESEE